MENKNASSIQEINEQILELENKILELETKLIESKRDFEIKLLDKTSEMEREYKNNKDPELSTIQKRDAKAMEDAIIYSLFEENRLLEHTIKVKKINLRYIERKFKISLKQIEYE